VHAEQVCKLLYGAITSRVDGAYSYYEKMVVVASLKNL
jgi:hypothetical protein